MPFFFFLGIDSILRVPKVYGVTDYSIEWQQEEWGHQILFQISTVPSLARTFLSISPLQVAL